MSTTNDTPPINHDPSRRGASRIEMLVFCGLLLGWTVIQAFVLPKSNST